MNRTRTYALWAGLLCVCAAVAVVVIINLPRVSNARTKDPFAVSTSEDDEENDPLAVKTILPKYQRSFVRSISAPAYVEAYFRADLYAEVAGPVKFIEKNIGDRVVKGEL